MKKILFVFVALFLVLTPAYGALSDATGLVNRLDVETSGHTFEVQVTSNFDIPNFEFNKDEKKLTFYISSGLENNLGEVILPRNLLGGNLTFYLNDQEYIPQIRTNEKISFVTLNFTGIGDNTLDIVGTDYLFGLTEIIVDTPPPDLISLDDYDEGSIYIPIIVTLLIIGVMVSVIILIVKRRK